MIRRVGVGTVGLALLFASGLSGPAGALPASSLKDRIAPQAAVDAAPFRLSAEAEAIKALLDGSVSVQGKRGKALFEGVTAFYRAHRFEPVWFKGGLPTPQALSLVGRMGAAAEDGLDPASYLSEALPATRLSDPDALARAELGLSLVAVRFVADLASGRFEPETVSPLITPTLPRPDAVDVLTRLTKAGNVDWAIVRFEPPFPEYRALKQKLAELRAAPAEQPIEVTPGPTLKPGDTDPRVALLRARLKAPLGEAADPDFYDDALFEAVGAFQAEKGLKPDGIVGPKTVAALNEKNGGLSEAAVLANMERWRWLPRELGAFHVFVNVPEFKARISRDGEDVFETRVVVGTPRTPTPIFSDEMEHIVVNPYWNIPESILSKEMLPAIRANPYGYFQRHGYEVVATVKGKARVVDPGSVDWWGGDLSKIRIRQPPGEANALGNMKFMFPNQHAVYLHDTSSRGLFSKAFRAFSHGCVRVDDPATFADVLLMDEPEWTGDRVRSLIGGKERYVNLARHIPVHIAYFTLRIDAEGKVSRFPDVYGHDVRMAPLLASAEARPETRPET